jgi:putative transposase
MPWKEQRIMGQKTEFVERVEKGEPISRVSRAFGISRMTGHKWMKRYKELGYEGLNEQSRRPKSAALATAEDLVIAVLEARESYPKWGPRKLEGVLRRRFKEQTPSERTIARILRRAHKVRSRKRLRPLNVVERAPQVEAKAPNDIWTVDFKGWWRTQDGERCDPLTVRDAKSRYILTARLCKQDIKDVRAVFVELFKKYGIPGAIQCDNGVPFIAMRARAGLTMLSAWWISLGIRLVRSRPGCPQDNGAHERMHRDMRSDVQNSPAEDFARQQRVLEKWTHQFNHIRPHDALKGKTPAEVYKAAVKKKMLALHPSYPVDFTVVTVGTKGTLRFKGTTYALSQAVAGREVGIEQLDALKLRIWFYDLDLGTIDIEPDVDESIYTDFRSHKKSNSKLAA